MASDSYDQTRDPRTGRPRMPIEIENAHIDSTDDAPQSPSNAENQVESLPQPSRSLSADVAGVSEQRPEALAQFAESARNSEISPKHLTADDETAPIPTDNRVKHDVATKLLNEGAHGRAPDPDTAGEDRLPNRITREISEG